jgi:hypothetical protein
MRRALVVVAVAGWSLAGFIAYLIVIHLAWFGVMLIGIITLLAGQFAEMDDEAPASSPYLLARRYEQTFEGNAETRMARFAARLERHKWLYITRTIGIALTLLGLNMFITRQL